MDTSKPRFLLGWILIITFCAFSYFITATIDRLEVHAQIGTQTYYSGTSGSIGGSALLAGACSTGSAAVTGAQVGQPVSISASDGTNIPAVGATIFGTVTSANTVTVSVCAIIALTPAAKTYNVRVFP